MGPDGTYTLTLASATDTTPNIDDGTTSASTILGNIQTLNGGAGADTFVVNTTASGVTAINGGAGNDVFIFFGALPVTAGITISGQADTDTLDLSSNTGTINITLTNAGSCVTGRHRAVSLPFKPTKRTARSTRQGVGNVVGAD